ncbi:hypothetical protein N431DRAFT_475317 [Stipitochalara longipes BDJ]|nr:hypothetical protein N431DRAFT_475317 [Stipitochalara longipes BDJ]
MRFNLALIATALLGVTLASPTACGSHLKVRADQSANTALVLTVNGSLSSSPPLLYFFHIFRRKHKADTKNHAATLSPDISWNCIVNCGGILLESACIAGAIAVGEPELILDCIDANNWSDVCGCINCIPGLSTFLHNHGICK